MDVCWIIANFADEMQRSMDKGNKTQVVVWLKVTDYMHGWMQHELGGGARVKDQKVVCIGHLEGVKDVMRMEAAVDPKGRNIVVNAMSANTRNCIVAGTDIDREFVVDKYGMTADQLEYFMPIECPRMYTNDMGVLRPWTSDVSLGKEQATALQRLLRNAFWKAVERYDRKYAATHGKSYPAVEMIEAFCQETRTPDLYVEAMRREWQRRVKRAKEK